MVNVQEFVTIASTVIFIVGVTTNIIFIYMIRKGTRSAVGQVYKNIMTSFAVCNIAFGSAEFIAKPGNFIYGTSLMTFSHGIFQREKPWGFISLCIFIGMYGTSTALLTLHFVYRYIANCKHHLLHIFHKKGPVCAVILAIVSWGTIYGLITFFCFAPGEEYYSYANAAVYAKFGDDAHHFSFFTIFTHEVKGNVTTIYWSSTLGLGIIYLMMLITFALMLTCGIKLYRNLAKSTMSQKSRKLQTQLLKALIVQAAVPCLTSYLSRVVMYSSVVMGLPPLSVYSFTPLVVTIYTVIDPIAIMLFICDYQQIVNNLNKTMRNIHCYGTKIHENPTTSRSQPSIKITESSNPRTRRSRTTVIERMV